MASVAPQTEGFLLMGPRPALGVADAPAVTEANAPCLERRDGTMQGPRLRLGNTAARSFPSRQTGARYRSAVSKLFLKAGETARSAQHATGNLDNGHVEIVCAASARVNVSVLYQFVDTANWTWPTCRPPRWGFSRPGSAARSPERWPAGLPRGHGFFIGSRPSTRAQGRGSLVAAPSNRGT
jgi:hypothetical protein